MVKARIVTFCAPEMRRIVKKPLSAGSGTMTVGALITAAHCFVERNWMLFFPEPDMITCSWYVPGQTSMWSPGCASFTAAWIDMYCAVGHWTRSSSTSNLAGPANEAMSRAPVGVSVRSQAAPRYAIAGTISMATVLCAVSIGLLLAARRRYSSLRLDGGVPQLTPEPPHWEDGWPLIAPDPTQTAVNGVLVRRLEDELVIDGVVAVPVDLERDRRPLLAIIPFVTRVAVEAAQVPQIRAVVARRAQACKCEDSISVRHHDNVQGAGR